MKDNNMLEQGYKRIVYCDLDGVLCDFDKGIYDIAGMHVDNISDPEMWKRIEDYGKVKFFSELDWFPGGEELWSFIIDNFLKVKILSALGKKDRGQTSQGKLSWLRHNIPSLNLEDIILVENKHKKRHYSKQGDIIIDDTPLVIQEWIEKGGIGILHKTASDTINKLKYFV